MPNPRRGSTDSRTSTVPTKRYRSACDMCHQTKIKCTGGPQCDECIKLGVTCRFSTSDRIGRPKGARNKSTLERIRNYEAQASAGDSTRQTAQEDVPSSNTGTNVFGDLQDMDALDLFQSPWLNTNAFYENETENENSGQRNHYNVRGHPRQSSAYEVPNMNVGSTYARLNESKHRRHDAIIRTSFSTLEPPSRK